MDLDPVLLARLQFAATVAFHILFPAITIGLSAYLLYFEWRYLKTGEAVWKRLYKFWSKIFALSFGMGVVSGIPMAFQFGTNWSVFSEAGGNVLAPLLGYEVLTAFFLEASFLGIMLFGWDRVGPKLHFLSTAAVAAGTLLSSFWILSANSWMQTPAGYRLEDGVFFVESWWEVIFNPSFPYRFFHMVSAAYLTSSLVVAGISAFYLLRERYMDAARPAFRAGALAVAVLAPVQLVVGDLHGLNTYEHQPAKVAAMEGHWQSRQCAPFLIFAIPDQQAQRNRAELGVPCAASFILEHDPTATVTGLDAVPADEHPPVALTFFAFRIMLYLGFLMIAFGLAGAWLAARGRLFEARWYHRWAEWMTPTGFIAVLAGWVVTEVGRQPWIVQGLVRTKEAASPTVAAPEIMASLMAFMIVYSLIMVAFLYFSWRVLMLGPAPEPAEAPGRAERPGLAGWEPAQ